MCDIFVYCLYFQCELARLEIALGRMDEAFESIAQYEEEVAELLPRLRSAQTQVQNYIQQVDKYKQEYVEVCGTVSF